MMQLSKQRAVAFTQAVHLLDHVGELLDVERGDCGHFPDLLRLVVVVGWEWCWSLNPSSG